MKEKCIISISHSNYLYKNAGTEKCMREISSILRKDGIHYLQFFSFEKYSKLYKISNMSDKIGVNYDDLFYGIYDYASLPGLFNKIQKERDVTIVGIHINNVINHDLRLLKKFIIEVNLPIVVWLHDYSSICEESPILLKKSGECCNNFVKNIKICRECPKYSIDLEYNDKIYDFYTSIDDFIETVIAPSESVINNIQKRYHMWKEKLYLRPHLCIFEVAQRELMSAPIRVAYVGGKYEHKGYSEWIKLIEKMKNDSRYEFYYLGSAAVNSDKYVKNIFVDVATQGENAMKDAIKNNQIDIVILWSKCQETYSYTYFEALCGGARVITYSNSGNIADRVKLDCSGVIYSDINQLIDAMSCYESFKNELNEIQPNYYSKYEVNDSLNFLISNGKYHNKKSEIRVKCFGFLTILYVVSSQLKNLKGRFKSGEWKR